MTGGDSGIDSNNTTYKPISFYVYIVGLTIFVVIVISYAFHLVYGAYDDFIDKYEEVLYSDKVKISNYSKHDLTLIAYPITEYSESRKFSYKWNIKKGKTKVVLLYVGKEIKYAHLYVAIDIWLAENIESGNISAASLYGKMILHNPDYKEDPNKSIVFAELEIR